MTTATARVRVLGWQLAAVLMAIILAVAAWAVAMRDTTGAKVLPKLTVPKVAHLTSWINSCNVAATVWETTVVYGAMADPPVGFAYALGGWALAGFGAYATADACATDAIIHRIPFGTCHIVLGQYKGTYNGAKYYYPAAGSICNV
jgi:hypothetical protein